MVPGWHCKVAVVMIMVMVPGVRCKKNEDVKLATKEELNLFPSPSMLLGEVHGGFLSEEGQERKFPSKETSCKKLLASRFRDKIDCSNEI